MMKITYLPLALLMLFALAGTPAYAQLLDASGTLNLDASTSIGSDESETNVSTDVQATTSIGTQDAMSASSTEDGSSESSALLSFKLDRGNVNSNTEYSIRSVGGVRSMAGLESYAGASVRDDERLKSVALENDELTVRYKTDAKFLGFIPSSVEVTATVAADGTVSVRYPWYAFLMATTESRADLEARLAAEQASVQSEISVNTNQAHAWALMLESLRDSLSAGIEAEVSA